MAREDQIEKRYDDKFNRVKAGEQAAGEQAGEQAAYNREFEDIAKNNPELAQLGESVAAGTPSNNQFGYQKDNTVSKKGNLRARLNKYGPTGGIIGGLLAIIFGAGVFIAPSLAMIHLKQVLTEDLNDQLAAMDIRSVHVLKAKVADLGKRGVVCKAFSCGLRGMTDKQIQSFEKVAGFDLEKGPKNSFGKTPIYAITATKSDGTKVKVTSVSEFNKLLGDKGVRNQLRRAYNPRFYSTWDKTLGKALARFKTSKADKLKGSSDEERSKSLKAATSGDNATLDGEPVGKECGDDKACQDNEDKRREKEKSESAKLTEGGGRAGSVFSGAVKGLGILGAADSTCTVYNTSRAVEAGAKFIRSEQVAQYAMVFNTLADMELAGDASHEQATYGGNITTAVDRREKVVNEYSKNQSDKVENPYFGKNAFDSEGAKAAFYNDAANLTAQAQQFTVGGGLVGTLASVNSKIQSVVGDNPEATCGKIQNPWVRGGSFVVGLLLGVGSGGTTIAAGVALSGAAAAALPVLEAYLKDMLAGETVGPDTKGVDSGNAIFSGTGVILGAAAQARGMKPASKSDLKSYLATSNEIKQEYVAMGVEDAKSTPFDIKNEYSFTGMLARKILPSYMASSSFASTLTSGFPKLFASATSSALPNVEAVGEFNPERFSKCNDSGYKKLRIDADIFCNVRYTMSPQELNMPTEDVYEWMYANKQINEDFSAKEGSKYEEFVKNCVDRTTGWGTPLEGEENSSIGEDCMKNDTEHHYFRAYTMDRSIEEGMDEGPETGTDSTPNSGAGTSFTLGTYNQPLRVGEEKHKKATAVIVEKGMDIVGTQETTNPKYSTYKTELAKQNYGVYPDRDIKKGDKYINQTCSYAQSIFYNKAKFEIVEEESGWFEVPRYPERAQNCGDGEKTVASKSRTVEGVPNLNWDNLPSVWTHIPYATFKDVDTQQKVIVMNTHNVANVKGARGTNPAYSRFVSANIYVYQVKLLRSKYPGVPIFFTGDFNEGYGVRNSKNVTYQGNANNLLFCMFAKNGLMFSASGPKMSQCGKGVGGVDFIYSTQGVKVDANHELSPGQAFTDHPARYVKLTVPGSGEGGAIGSNIAGDDYSRECTKYLSSDDCTEQCVAFVKFRLVKHGVIKPMSLGNGKDVVRTLGRVLGVTVNKTPAVNAVFSTSATSQPDVGHTGMVSAVHKDGSITVEEYNFTNPLHYGTRKLSKAEYTSKGYTFAHTETKYK